MTILLFCSCGLLKEKGTFRDKLDEIQAIKIVKLGTFNQETVLFDEEELANCSDLDAIKNELLQLPFHSIWNDPYELQEGEVVFKIIYNNGDFDLIGASAQWKYRAEKWHYGYTIFDKQKFEQLIAKYVA